jgi:hypothetical protein
MPTTPPVLQPARWRPPPKIIKKIIGETVKAYDRQIHRVRLRRTITNSISVADTSVHRRTQVLKVTERIDAQEDGSIIKTEITWA